MAMGENGTGKYRHSTHDTINTLTLACGCVKEKQVRQPSGTLCSLITE
jgi:hypothetical protein